jgi:hypothetical protein
MFLWLPAKIAHKDLLTLNCMFAFAMSRSPENALHESDTQHLLFDVLALQATEPRCATGSGLNTRMQSSRMQHLQGITVQVGFCLAIC